VFTARYELNQVSPGVKSVICGIWLDFTDAGHWYWWKERAVLVLVASAILLF